MKIYYKNKSWEIDVKRLKYIQMGFGLMFKFKKEKAENLLFDISSKKNIAFTGLFVFIDFLVVWLDENNNIVDWKVVRPFTLNVEGPKKFKKLLEIPLNRKNRGIVGFFRREKERFK